MVQVLFYSSVDGYLPAYTLYYLVRTSKETSQNTPDDLEDKINFILHDNFSLSLCEKMYDFFKNRI